MIKEAIEKVQALIGATAKPETVRNANGGTAQVLVVPRDFTVQTLTSTAPIPARLTQDVQFDELDAFGAYLSRYGTPEGTVIFLEQTETTITMDAFLDYHRHIREEDKTKYGDVLPAGNVLLPQWGSHRAAFRPAPTPEWVLWNEKNKKVMEQIDFARFLEENYPDIAEPLAADLIQICRGLELVGNVHYLKAFREQDGMVHLQYKEENKPNGEVVVPEEITLRIAPYKGENTVDLKAKLRYRLRDGQCVFYFELVRPHKVLEACATEMREQIAVITNKQFPIYSGKAEAPAK